MPVAEHPTLRELIRARQQVTGWSQADLEKASNYQVKKQSFGEWVNYAPKSWPKRNETILGLAEALDVTPETVILAWATSLGLPVKVRQPLIALQMPPAADTLTDAERNSIIAMIRAITAGRDVSEPSVDGAQQEPSTAAGAERIAAAGRALRSKSRSRDGGKRQSS